MSRWESLSLATEGLSLFRRGLGLLCLLDAVQRLSQAAFLYSDVGVLPRYAYFRFFDDSYSWSLYLLSGSPVFVSCLLLLSAGLGLGQMCGRSRRVSRLGLWALMASIQARHPGLLDSADDLLRLMLFWDIFLPTLESGASRDIRTLATLGLQWQLSLAAALGIWFGGVEAWRLAGQWDGGRSVAWMGEPWNLFLASMLLSLTALWWRASRRYLLPLIGLNMLGLAWLSHPSYPMVWAVSLLCLYSPRGRPYQMESRGQNLASRRWALVAWALTCLVSTAWCLVPSPSEKPLLAFLGGVGRLDQNWDRIYPLNRRVSAELICRMEPLQQPLLKLSLDQGRRLRLLSQAIVEDVRLATPLAQALAKSHPTGRPVDVWLKTEELSPDLLLGVRSVSLLVRVPTTPLEVK